MSSEIAIWRTTTTSFAIPYAGAIQIRFNGYHLRQKMPPPAKHFETK